MDQLSNDLNRHTFWSLRPQLATRHAPKRHHAPDDLVVAPVVLLQGSTAGVVEAAHVHDEGGLSIWADGCGFRIFVYSFLAIFFENSTFILYISIYILIYTFRII